MNLQGRNIYSWVARATRPATQFVIVSPFFRVNTPIESPLNSVRSLRIVVGDEFSINDPRPLRRLSQRASHSVTYIDTKEFGSRLHAKVFYAAEPSGRRQALVGSANFTVSGLTKNEEQAISFDSDCDTDRPILREIELWIDELAKSACEVDWDQAERQYQGTRDPNKSSDGFDTYLQHRAQNFWVLKTTAGSGGTCYWPEFVKEGVISIGWEDIVRIIGDEAGLDPHEYTYEAVYAAAVQSIGLANGWRLMWCRPMGADRIEVVGLVDTDLPVVKRLGCVTEIVSWRTRVFAPGADVIGRLLDRYPLGAADA